MDTPPRSLLRILTASRPGYSSHVAYEKECLNCHAPMGCLAANLCQDCHREVTRECTETTEASNGMPPSTDTYQISRIEQPERDDVACDVPLGALSHEQLSGFSLDLHETGFDGKALACESCHPDGLYDADSVACAGCHAKEAPAYMAEHTTEHGGDCASATMGGGVATSLVEGGEVHALDGTHEEAGCHDCHTGSTFADEVRDCAGCHEEPEVHAGETGLHCDWCHTVVAWLPAQLAEHGFRLDHGGLDEASCEACHTGTYETYSCYGCHDHQLAEMQENHGLEGSDQLGPCGQCHPTGASGEAARLGHGLGGQSTSVEAPGGGAEVALPGQEGVEQTGPVDTMTGPVDTMIGPVDSMTGPAEPTGSSTGARRKSDGARRQPDGRTRPGAAPAGRTGRCPDHRARRAADRRETSTGERWRCKDQINLEEATATSGWQSRERR